MNVVFPVPYAFFHLDRESYEIYFCRRQRENLNTLIYVHTPYKILNLNTMSTIEFEHYGRVIRAAVIYNFQEIPCVITIIPQRPLKELGERIIFLKKGGVWTLGSPAYEQYPETVQNIMDALNEFFHKEFLWDHVFFLRNLSS